MRLDGRAHPGDAERDAEDVPEDAGENHESYVFAAKALTQHEGVLRPDGDDEPGARAETRECGGNVHEMSFFVRVMDGGLSKRNLSGLSLCSKMKVPSHHEE